MDFPLLSLDASGWRRDGLAELESWCAEHTTGQLLVLDRGRVVLEWYGNGAEEATAFDVASVQKSLTSFVVGVLIARGSIGLDAPVSTWLEEGWTRATPAQEREIRLRHLLSMTSGLFDDFGRETDPGTRWYYNNNAYHQVRKIIERVCGSTCQDVFGEILFDRIGMKRSEWRDRPRMIDPAGWVLQGLYSTARDMARFGLLVLAKGRWAGTDLGCDPAYLAASLSPSTQLNPSYGYLWWLLGGERAIVPGMRPGEKPDRRKLFGGVEVSRRLAPSAPRDACAGMGAGDQRLYVVPSLDLVVVRHGRPAQAMSAAGGSFDETFWKLLSAALPPGMLSGR